MMIDCAKAHELSDSYIDGELEEADCLAYEEHISCCDACHEEYDILKKISADLSSTAAPLPEGFAARAHTALVEEQLTARKNKDKKFVFPYYRTASVMAAALIIAVVGKYGIYDTYKKVNDDASRMAAEIEAESDTQLSEFENIPDVKGVERAAVMNEPMVKSTLTESESTVISENAYAGQIQTSQEPGGNTPEDKADNGIAGTADLSDVYSSATGLTTAVEEAAPKENNAAYNPEASDTITNEAEDTISMVRMVEPDADPVIVSDSDEKVSSGGASEAMKKAVAPSEPESDAQSGSVGGGGTATSPTKLVPTTVIIYNSGDGSMMMFKKFLLTFLDSSEIKDNGGEITVTVTADEYDGVMQYIKSNEYVKSVTEGTPFGGKAVINIK